jgi:hypothetical protein
MKLRVERKVREAVFGHIRLLFHVNIFLNKARKIYPLAPRTFIWSFVIPILIIAPIAKLTRTRIIIKFSESLNYRSKIAFWR